MRRRANRYPNPNASIALLVAGLLFAACGGGGAGVSDPDPTPGIGVTAFAPTTFPSEIPTAFTVTGSAFTPTGGTATVRLVATAGTPFAGGTQATHDLTGTIDGATQISGTTDLCGVTADTSFLVTVVLPSAAEGTSAGPLGSVEAPTVTACAPQLLESGLPKDFVVTGTDFAPTSASVTVRFRATTGTPFLDDTSATLDVPGLVTSPTQVTGTTVLDGVSSETTASVHVIFPSGAQASSAGALVTMVPSWKITANDGTDGDGFGAWTMAVQGNYAVAGTSTRDVGADEDVGAAYVFERVGQAWTQRQKLTAPDAAAHSLFGSGVAISGDTIAIGAQQDDEVDEDAGAVYVFVRSGNSWTFQQKLTDPDGAFWDNLGLTVAIDGDTIVAGAQLDDVGTVADAGSAVVWTRSGSTWSFQQKLTAPDGLTNDDFGARVDVSGNTVIVGADDHVHAGGDVGSAYVFTRSGTTWTLQQEIRNPNGSVDVNFGWGVAIDGNTAILGARDEAGLGAAYVFTRTGSLWTQQQRLTAPDGLGGDGFGNDVDVRGDRAIVGAPWHDVERGAAYVFDRAGATWTLTKLLAPIELQPGDHYGGGAVRVSEDTAVVGAGGDDEKGDDAGAAYIH